MPPDYLTQVLVKRLRYITFALKSTFYPNYNIDHSPNTPSWRGALLKHRDKFCPYLQVEVFWVSEVYAASIFTLTMEAVVRTSNVLLPSRDKIVCKFSFYFCCRISSPTFGRHWELRNFVLAM